MFKFIAVCFYALLAVAVAKPGVVASLAYSAPIAAAYSGPLAYSAPVVAPLAYSAPLTYAAGPAAAAVVGHASYVAPYAASYNAHQVAHSAAFPAAYAAAPVLHASAPIISAAYSAPIATPLPAAPVWLKK